MSESFTSLHVCAESFRLNGNRTCFTNPKKFITYFCIFHVRMLHIFFIHVVFIPSSNAYVHVRTTITGYSDTVNRKSFLDNRPVRSCRTRHVFFLLYCKKSYFPFEPNSRPRHDIVKSTFFLLGAHALFSI